MERSELKELLKELGVREELTEMPAIVEPLYKEWMEKTASAVKSSGDILVLANGDFKVGKKSVEFEITGGARVSYDDVTIDINEYGIEKSYSDGDFIGLFSHVTRKDGIVECSSGNNGNGTMSTNKYYDNGSWSIQGANGPLIDQKDEDGNLTEVDEAKLLEDFDKMAKTMKKEYPKTKEWYDKKREELQKALAEFNSPEARFKAEMSALRKENSALKTKNEALTKNNEKLTDMLGKALDFMEEVKKSPVGKLFFRKGLKKYEESSRVLGPGRDDD